MSLTIKASLYRHDWRREPVEIRRFTIDAEVATNYSYLVQKLTQVFPALREDNITTTVAWKDSDGDRVVISSDEELTDALDQFDGSAVFKLQVKISSPSRAGSCYWRPANFHFPGAFTVNQQAKDQQEAKPADTEKTAPTKKEKEGEEDKQAGQEKPQQGPFHPGVICDGCSSGIYGTRFKCLVCPDYDLCTACETKGIHGGHNMLTIETPRPHHPWTSWGSRGWFGPWALQGGPWAGGRPFWGRGCPAQSCERKQETEPKPTTDDQQTESSSTEDQQKLFENLANVASNFLQPFGFRVNLENVNSQQSAVNPDTNDSQSDASASSKAYEDTIKALESMGFHDEGGWLTELVRTKNGNLEQVLDALQPNKPDEQ